MFFLQAVDNTLQHIACHFDVLDLLIAFDLAFDGDAAVVAELMQTFDERGEEIRTSPVDEVWSFEQTCDADKSAPYDPTDGLTVEAAGRRGHTKNDRATVCRAVGYDFEKGVGRSVSPAI